MSYILCLETSTDICSVSVISENGILATRETEKSHSHTKVITVFIKECMDHSEIKYSDLKAVAIASGPGSYTSLRIGSATAKGLCYAQNIPLITIDSLKIIAAGMSASVKEADYFIPMIDARRAEVYYAIYDHHLQTVKPVNNLILTPDCLIEYNSKIVHIGGDGADKASAILTPGMHFHKGILSSSRWMNELVYEAYKNEEFADLAYFSPNYFKNPNITRSTKKLF